MSVKYVPRNMRVEPGEITLKEFCVREAEIYGVRPHSIYARLSRGSYPEVLVRRVNKRIVFVKP